MWVKSSMLGLSMLLFNVAQGTACTNLIVGKKASADGSVMISYSADSYGMFGSMWHFPAGKHAPGSKREIRDWESNAYRGVIDEAPETYNVIGNINEYQVSIGETTFGGREELVDTTALLDYGSLIYLGLQRSKTAREAIRVITGLVKKYGYASEGESFTIADPNEAWIMEMVGKRPGSKGAVWIAMRIPDDCISAHANQSRIRKIILKDADNCMYAPDVISFARKKGYFKGKDADFDFASAYCPLDFSSRRFCEARVWSFFNRWCSGMDKYVDYVAGIKDGCEPMPLYVKPNRLISVRDMQACMRDHYEGTPFDVQKDAGMGQFEAPYRQTPLTWKYEGKTYFNERPISTQQAAFVFVSQLRSFLPNAVGGILWFGNDDANMVPFTPVYCCTTEVPECYSGKNADDVTFSWKSAYWVCNWVSNMVYPRYSMLFGDVKTKRDALEDEFVRNQPGIEQQAAALWKTNPTECKTMLGNYSAKQAEKMLETWKELGLFLVVKYNDQVEKPEKDGVFERTPNGIGVTVKRPGYTESFKRTIIRETGDKYLVPQEKKP